jgi:hypothetical protein
VPYFLDSIGTVHFLSDEDIANGCMMLLPVGVSKITEEQAQTIKTQGQTSTPVPIVVFPVQAFIALDENGHLAKLMDYLSAPTTSHLIRAVVTGATEWRRDSLMLMSVAIALGFTVDQVDDLFVRASKIAL